MLDDEPMMGGMELEEVETASRPRESLFEATTRMAVAAMERWRLSVRSLPTLSSEHESPLGGLVAWYERVCVDERYAIPPPVEGMDALFVIEQERSAAAARGLVVARWAVRVAEELVLCRQMANEGNATPEGMGLTRLELALHAALARIGSTASRHFV